MAQQVSPYLEAAYGWNFGEGGWNTGMDQNLLKFSFMFDRNVDSITAALPAAVNGQAHYLTTDNRLYFAVGTTYFSTPTPKWFTIFVRSTGQTHQFNGTALVQIDTPAQLKSRLDAVELTVSTLGTAAFKTTEFFASKAQLDVASAQANAYTDGLRTDVADVSTPSKGAGQIGRAAQVVNSIAALKLLLKTSASKSAFVTGYYAEGDGGGGAYYLDAADTTSVDNGGTIIVATDGGRWKLVVTGSVSIKQFGARGDGITDDTAAVQAALNYASSVGFGKVLIPWGMRVRILGNVTVPTGCSLIGEQTPPLGQIGAYNYLLLEQTVLLNATATITLNGDSQVRRLCFLRDGMSWDLTRAQVDATFAGSCLTLADGQSDITINECAFFGFDYAIRTAAANLAINRLHLSHINMDCKNGILINNCYDVSYLREIHSWPWVSVSSPAETGGAQLKRSGVAFSLTGVNDWTDIQSCFDYGHYRGFLITDGNDVTLTNCKADNSFDAAGDGTIGFLINGQASGVRLVAPQAAGRQFGIWLDCLGTANADQDVTIIAPNVWVFKNTAIVVDRGRAVILGPNLRNGPTNTGAGTGIDVTTANGAYAAVTSGLIKGTAAGFNGNVRHSGVIFESVATLVSNSVVVTIASADPLLVNGSEIFYVVSGSTSFGTLSNSPAYAGKLLTLLFTGAPLLLNGGGMRLAGGVNFQAAAGNTITFVSDGTLFHEVSRKV